MTAERDDIRLDGPDDEAVRFGSGSLMDCDAGRWSGALQRPSGVLWSGLRRPEGHTGYRFLRNSTAANGNTEKEEEKTDESNTAAEKG